MSHALVTGGHGFVASHLARALLEGGGTVRVLDRPDPREAAVGLALAIERRDLGPG